MSREIVGGHRFHTAKSSKPIYYCLTLRRQAAKQKGNLKVFFAFFASSRETLGYFQMAANSFSIIAVLLI